MSDVKIAFEKLVSIMLELREKCPWDKKQTNETLRYLTIEECYELSDAIIEKDDNSSASIRSINVEEKKNSINNNNSNNNVSLTKKTSISDVIHEGYLWKKGGGTSMFGKKNWKKRWFALHTDLKLSYYDDENENHLKGVIHIHGARLRVTANTGKIGSHHQKHTIIITQKPPQPPRPYEVVAETPERHEKWLEVLNVAIRAKKPEIKLESV